MHSEAFKRKRQLLLVAPLFIIPFLCLLFWAAGGGQGKAQAAVVKNEGLNTNLPSTVDNQILSKDDAYKRLVEDSVNRAKLADENYVYSSPDPYSQALKNPTGLNSIATTNSEEVPYQVNSTLNDMRRELSAVDRNDDPHANLKSPAEEYADQMKLTKQLLSSDPQYQLLMKQLSLGNIKPDSENEKVVLNQKKDHYVPIQQSKRRDEVVSRLNPIDTGITITEQRFFSGTVHQTPRSGINTISGVVHNDQTVREGTIIKLRLTNDINLSGMVIPENTFVYGTATLGNERLKVEVNSISYQNSIYPLKLLVYDVDGIAGIRIPGGVDKETRKQAVQQVVTGSTSSLGSVGVTVNNSSDVKQQVAGQVTASVLEAGKQLLSKKIAEERVFIKAGYKVYLK